MRVDDALLAAILRRLAASESLSVYRGFRHPINDEGDEVEDRWLLTIDGEVEVSEEELAAFQAAEDFDASR